MPEIKISLTDEGYAMVQDHLATLQKLNDTGTQWIPLGMTVDEWAEKTLSLAMEPMFSTSRRQAVVAAREAAEQMKADTVGGLLFDRTARGAGK